MTRAEVKVVQLIGDGLDASTKTQSKKALQSLSQCSHGTSEGQSWMFRDRITPSFITPTEGRLCGSQEVPFGLTYQAPAACTSLGSECTGPVVAGE